MAGTKADYDKLGLPATADRKVVEMKYGAWLRSYKHKVDEHGETEEDRNQYIEMTQAYDNIVGTVHNFKDPNPTSPVPFKVRNFFYKLSANLDHYKFFIVGFIMVAIIVIIVATQIAGNKNDVYVKFVGAFYAADNGAIEKEINDKTEFDNSKVTFYSITIESNINDTTAQNQANQFYAQYLTGAVDVILIDKYCYDVYVAKDKYVFLELSEFLEENEDAPGFENLKTYSYENQGEGDQVPSGIYGIEFTKTAEKIFSEENFRWLSDTIEGEEREMILCICRVSRNMDSAKTLAKALISLT